MGGGTIYRLLTAGEELIAEEGPENRQYLLNGTDVGYLPC